MGRERGTEGREGKGEWWEVGGIMGEVEGEREYEVRSWRIERGSGDWRIKGESGGQREGRW